MADGPGLRAHNVEATFRDEMSARRAREQVERSGLRVSVTVEAPEDRRAALRAEMRDEVEASVVGPGNVGPFTKGMTKGIARWVPAATAIGAVLGLLAGLFPWGETIGLWARLLIGAVIGAVAGATAGFVAGGGFRPRREREGERLESEAGVTVGVHGEDPGVIDRAATILADAGAIRVDRVDAAGEPGGPSTKEAMQPLRGDTPTTPPQSGGDRPGQSPRSQTGG